MTCFRERTRVKIGVFYGKKHALINSRERTRIWLHTRHPSGAIEPRGVCRVDVAFGQAGLKNPLYRAFSAMQRGLAALRKVPEIRLGNISTAGLSCQGEWRWGLG